MTGGVFISCMAKGGVGQKKLRNTALNVTKSYNLQLSEILVT